MKIGDLIDGYKVVDYIGAGGMGTVYHVSKDGKDYALKTCRTDDAESVLRFKREVRLMKSINDSNVINVIDENLDTTSPYFVMDLCDESLEDIVESGITEEERFDYVIQLCSGIKVLHDKGIIHRDIKPSNALLQKNTLKVSDLGLGKFVVRDSATLTPTNDKTIGTYDYISPEIYNNGEGRNADKRSDIYSIGKLIYYVFSEGESPLHVNVTKVKADIYSIINKCTKISPEDRYQDVSEIINALNIFQKSREIVISFEEMISAHKTGINDSDFAGQVYRYLLTLQDDLGLLIKDLRSLKSDGLKLILKYKQEDVSNLINLLLTTHRNNDRYWIQFEDIDILVDRARILMQATKILQEKQDLIEFSISLSIEYNRWSAMGTVVDMLHDLSEKEIKAMALFFTTNKEDVNLIRDNVRNTIPEAIKAFIR